MSLSLPLIRFGRGAILKLFDGLTDEQLNTIPEGFNNNLIWNLGHLIASHQGVCYLKTGNAPTTSQELISTYEQGTAPKGDLSAKEIAEIKQLALSTLDDVERDYAAGKFKTYDPLTIGGLTITTIEDGLDFCAFHEAMHYGYCRALKRAVVGKESTLKNVA